MAVPIVLAVIVSAVVLYIWLRVMFVLIAIPRVLREIRDLLGDQPSEPSIPSTSGAALRCASCRRIMRPESARLKGGRMLCESCAKAES